MLENPRHFKHLSPVPYIATRMNFYLVDAFTFPNIPFSGNVAAIVLAPTSDTSFSVASMQAVAKELNYSETAFVWPQKSPSEEHSILKIRYFTPRAEVSLCGHATLAASSIILRLAKDHPGFSQVAKEGQVSFQTTNGDALKCGIVPSAQKDGSQGEGGAGRVEGSIWMEFPISKVKEKEREDWDTAVLRCGVSPDIVKGVATTDYDLLVELESVSDVKNLEPNYRELGKVLREEEHRGLIVTSRMDDMSAEQVENILDAKKGSLVDKEFHFCSRFFAPHMGIDEDPVTGSAHCALAPYWSKRMNGKRMLSGIQLSERRGYIEIDMDETNKLVRLYGNAECVAKGEILSKLVEKS